MLGETVKPSHEVRLCLVLGEMVRPLLDRPLSALHAARTLALGSSKPAVP